MIRGATWTGWAMLKVCPGSTINWTRFEPNPSCNPSIPTRAQSTGFSPGSCLTRVKPVLRLGWTGWTSFGKLEMES